ncbi:hypothetical protein CI102_3943 [Trichoderma harzianum]|nr:hypothetical protein CI102_3943 [Trichoderma harzianum]
MDPIVRRLETCTSCNTVLSAVFGRRMHSRAPRRCDRPSRCPQLVLQGQQAPERHSHVPLRVTRLAVQRRK